MPSTRVGAILQRQGSIVFPGVYDTLSAKIVERAGFPMTFISGYSVAATAIGEPDLGLLTQTEIVERARRAVGGPALPPHRPPAHAHRQHLHLLPQLHPVEPPGAGAGLLAEQE